MGESATPARPGGPIKIEPHDIPSAAELTAAVRDFLAEDVLPAVEGRVRFHTRVAINVLGMVAREIELGAGHREAHAVRLRALDVQSDAELAAAIRDGRMPDSPELVETLRAAVRDKLAVANPDYL